MSVSRPPSGKRITNSLVALGSAAVLTVYAAGYARTRAAAARLDEMEHRRPPIPAPPESGPPVPMPEPPRVAELKAAPAPSVTPKAPKRSSTFATVAAATPTTPATEPATPAAQPASAAATTPAPVTPAPATPPAAAAAETKPAEPTAPANPLYKDGSYYGWGTSRHGDIQAGVTIENGRIASAWISQCLTRYSCSWISALPPQVAQRQSANVDYVSGATQSTWAFYYAVLEALSKAK